MIGGLYQFSAFQCVFFATTILHVQQQGGEVLVAILSLVLVRETYDQLSLFYVFNLNCDVILFLILVLIVTSLFPV